MLMMPNFIYPYGIICVDDLEFWVVSTLIRYSKNVAKKLSFIE